MSEKCSVYVRVQCSRVSGECGVCEHVQCVCVHWEGGLCLGSPSEEAPTSFLAKSPSLPFFPPRTEAEVRGRGHTPFSLLLQAVRFLKG